MGHFLSFIAGRGAKKATRYACKELGLDDKSTKWAGIAAQVGVGIVVGVVTVDLGGKAATVFDALRDSAADGATDSIVDSVGDVATDSVSEVTISYTETSFSSDDYSYISESHSAQEVSDSPRFGSSACPHCYGSKIWYGEICTWCHGTGVY